MIGKYIIIFSFLYIMGNFSLKGNIMPYIISITSAFLVAKYVVFVEKEKLKGIRKKYVALENITEFEEVRMN